MMLAAQVHLRLQAIHHRLLMLDIRNHDPGLHLNQMTFDA